MKTVTPTRRENKELPALLAEAAQRLASDGADALPRLRLLVAHAVGASEEALFVCADDGGLTRHGGSDLPTLRAAADARLAGGADARQAGRGRWPWRRTGKSSGSGRRR